MSPIDTQHTSIILTYSKYKSTKSVEVFAFPYLFELKITKECSTVEFKTNLTSIFAVYHNFHFSKDIVCAKQFVSWETWYHNMNETVYRYNKTK